MNNIAKIAEQLHSVDPQHEADLSDRFKVFVFCQVNGRLAGRPLVLQFKDQSVFPLQTRKARYQ